MRSTSIAEVEEEVVSDTDFVLTEEVEVMVGGVTVLGRICQTWGWWHTAWAESNIEGESKDFVEDIKLVYLLK